jgi:hypothetical protein
VAVQLDFPGYRFALAVVGLDALQGQSAAFAARQKFLADHQPPTADLYQSSYLRDLLL